MLDKALSDRFSRLLEVRIAERTRHFSDELRRLKFQAASKGMYRSGGYASQVFQAHERELEIRTIIAWESLVRAHKTLGVGSGCEISSPFKEEMRSKVDSFVAELTSSLLNATRDLPVAVSLSLAQMQSHLLKKHEVEIDLYEDSIVQMEKAPTSSSYNFYGSVGAVQTGAHSQANVVQNLGTADQSALVQALELAREAIRSAGEIGDRKQHELIEIVTECRSELDASSPNNTKLLTLFNVLATSIQTISSAQPAYQSLKSALLPLGITLP